MEKILDRSTLVSALEIYANNRLSDVGEDFEPSQRFEKKMERLIKSQSSLYYKVTLTRARRIMVIAAAISILIASLMSVSAVRETILGFFVSRESEAYSVTRAESDAKAPDTIETAFSLEEFPEGYKLSETVSDDEMYSLTLADGEKEITVSQFTKASFASAADADFSKPESVRNGDTDYIVRTLDETVHLVFERGGYVFEVIGELPVEDMLALASKVSVAG